LKKWYRHRDITVFGGFSDAQLGASPVFQRSPRASSSQLHIAKPTAPEDFAGAGPEVAWLTPK
jgi:hypothetical protein